MMVTHPDFVGVTAQLYPRDDPYLETDTACAVKDDLLLDFKPVTNDPNGATLDVEYDVRLVSKKYKPDSTMLMGNANGDNF
jgi:catechol 1,2-dioxygenase